MRSRKNCLVALIALLATVTPTVNLITSSAIPVLAQTTDAQRGEAEKLLNLCRENRKAEQYQEATGICQQAIKAFQTLRDRVGEARAIINLAWVHSSLKQHPQAIQLFQRGAVLAQQAGESKFEAEAWGGLGTIYLQLKQYQQAVSAFQKGTELAEKTNDLLSATTFLNALGSAYNFLDEHQLARQSLEKALQVVRRIDKRQTSDHRLEAIILKNLGLALNKLNEYKQAVQINQQAIELAQELDEQSVLAQALMGLASASSRLGQSQQAIKLCQQVLETAQKVNDYESEIDALRELASIYGMLGNNQKAIALNQQALEIAQKHRQLPREGLILAHLGSIYHDQSDIDKAIELYKQGLTVTEKIPEDRTKEQVTAALMTGLANAYFRLGQYSQAIDLFQAELTRSQKTRTRSRIVASLNNLGRIYRRVGKTSEAINLHQQALDIARKIEVPDLEQSTFLSLGHAYISQRQPELAIPFFQKAFKISQRTGGFFDAINALGGLGVAYHIAGQNQESVQILQQALALAQQANNPNLEASSLLSLGASYTFLRQDQAAIQHLQRGLSLARQIGDRSAEDSALYHLGLVALYSGNYSEAEKLFSESVSIKKTLRRGLKDTENISLFDTQSNTYVNLQKALIAQKKFAQGLQVSEEGRARAFIDLLNQRLVPNSEELLAENSPSIQQIQQIAKTQNATLVQYSIIHDENLYIWVIQPTGEITFRNVDLKVPAAEQSTQPAATATIPQTRSVSFQPVDDLRSTIRGLGAVSTDESSPQQSGNSLSFQANPREVLMQQQLKQLHTLLIEPIADLLPTNPDQRVIFVPQGSLFFVPFPALIDTEGKSLIEKHTILTAPSIQVLELTRQQRQRQDVEQKPTNTLLVGNPTMPKGLAPLPGAEAEANAIAEFLKISALIGNQATKATVVQQMPNATLIHLATHGLLDDMRGLGSAIALAPSVKDDGLLTAEEILDMKLRAELVVLSACDTGKGRLTGDGVIGLSRSLISAGVPSVIVSLWAVPDSPTAFLMTEFYRNLQKNPNKAQALRQAMLTTKQSYNNPINWAAFTLIGEAE